LETQFQLHQFLCQGASFSRSLGTQGKLEKERSTSYVIHVFPSSQSLERFSDLVCAIDIACGLSLPFPQHVRGGEG
jgi:hypothetical protein